MGRLLTTSAVLARSPSRSGQVRRPFSVPRGWELSGLPGPTLVLVLGVVGLAVASFAASLWWMPLRVQDVALFLGLLAAAVASVEASRRVPEPAGMNANDMLAAWCVPIAVLLPPVFSLAAAAALMAFTQWRVRRIAVYKRVYSAAAIGSAHAAASGLFHVLPEPWRDWGRLTENAVPLTLAVLGVAVLAKALNAGLVGAAVKSADPETCWRAAFVVDDGRLEATEVCAGVLIAVSVGVSPLLVLIALPPVLLLQRGMLYAQLHAAARTDAKTGLLNAVTWEREAAASLSAARRADRPVSVLLIDIDHFKRVNDTHGHLVGDHVLRGVADALRGQLRDARDLLGRFGGEEFAVFLPDVDDGEAAKAADRLRRAVADLVTPVDEGLVQVTVSVGAAVADRDSLRTVDVGELLARADLGLYRAKDEGRNQVRLLTRPDRRARPSGS